MFGIDKYFKKKEMLAAAILFHFGTFLPDKVYLSLYYRFIMGKKLNLTTPQSFGEKMQWLKLYDRRPEYSKLVDKYEVKEYVKRKVGSEFVIPTLGVWDSVDDIEWDKLPEQFVLKTTYGGGSVGVVICSDKCNFDKDTAIIKLNRSFKQDIYKFYREWPYKNIVRRIVAEEYVKPDNNEMELPDYKWYCFNGEPKYCQVIKNRSTKETIDFFDTEWNHQEFVGLHPAGGPVATPAAVEPKKPKNLEKQIWLARELSQGFPFVRVDLYDSCDRIFFGEMTFYPYSGFGVFSPSQYDKILGDMIELPDKNNY